jgi:hypothetical protein
MDVMLHRRNGLPARLWALALTVIAAVMAVAATGAQAQTTPPYTFTGMTGLGAAPNPWFVTFNKAGNLLAVVNVPLNSTPTSNFSISMFTVGGNGFLTPVAGSPFAVDGVVNSVAFNETGTLLAATKGLNSFLIYSVAPSGALTLLSTNSTVEEVTLPVSSLSASGAMFRRKMMRTRAAGPTRRRGRTRSRSPRRTGSSTTIRIPTVTRSRPRSCPGHRTAR